VKQKKTFVKIFEPSSSVPESLATFLASVRGLAPGSRRWL